MIATVWRAAPIAAMMLAVALQSCAPADNDLSERLSALEQRVAAIESSAAGVRSSGALREYTFVMADDPVSVALADEGELPVLVRLGDVTAQGDSQTVRLRVYNPTSFRLFELTFDVSWRASGSQSPPRTVEWNGAIDPGHSGEVSFRVGPVTGENLQSITIANMRQRWATRSSQ